ncbi:NeuD/PglB/VioB family sugar acetyltransferase [Candidatus Omnitrophota bacterium]
MRVAIFSAGGLAKVVCESLRLQNQHRIVGFFDDVKKGRFCGCPILGKCSQFRSLSKKLKIKGLFVAFGYHFLDKRLSYCKEIAREKELDFVNAVHPAATISSDAEIGKGVYIGPGVIVNPGTKIGDNSIIWSGTIIEHDNNIGKNVFISPGVRTAGYTEIGDNSFIGMGADITKAKIGRNVTVGTASLVLNNVKSNKYILGMPARIIKTKKKLSYV